MRPADAAVAAEALRRVLRAVERGELYASAIERHAIAGAVLALDAIAETSTGADQSDAALDAIAEQPMEADQNAAPDGSPETPDGDPDTSA